MHNVTSREHKSRSKTYLNWHNEPLIERYVMQCHAQESNNLHFVNKGTGKTLSRKPRSSVRR